MRQKSNPIENGNASKISIANAVERKKTFADNGEGLISLFACYKTRPHPPRSCQYQSALSEAGRAFDALRPGAAAATAPPEKRERRRK